MNYDQLLRENQGKEIRIITIDDHHYQGQLVGCQCRDTPYHCSHLIMLLMGVNYVDIAVNEISEVKVLEKITE